MNKTEKEVFKRAIERYGINDQTQVACEECSELIKALIKYHRVTKYQDYDKRKVQRCLNNIIEEIADVGIMLDQIKLMYGIAEKDVNAIREEKVARLNNALPED